MHISAPRIRKSIYASLFAQCPQSVNICGIGLNADGLHWIKLEMGRGDDKEKGEKEVGKERDRGGRERIR